MSINKIWGIDQTVTDKLSAKLDEFVAGAASWALIDESDELPVLSMRFPIEVTTQSSGPLRIVSHAYLEEKLPAFDIKVEPSYEGQDIRITAIHRERYARGLA